MKSRDLILHVEDTEEDVALLQFAFRRAQIENPVHVAMDGQQAIDYLAGNGAYADRGAHPLPRLVLLDLKLPYKTGFEVLEWIRQQPALDAVVVIVLSASVNESDIAQAYRLRANGFLVKPADANVTADMCRAMKHFWIDHNRVPHCAMI